MGLSATLISNKNGSRVYADKVYTIFGSTPHSFLYYIGPHEPAHQKGLIH